MADALEDPELEINYWVPDRAQWVDSTGGFTDQVPVPGSDRAATLINQPDGSPLAEIVHDESMLEQPDLIEAAIASTRLALQTNQMQAELTLSDERVQAAQSRAQRSLERDLHDGAQQRLIALRMKVSVLTRIMDQDSRRAAELARELRSGHRSRLVRGTRRRAWPRASHAHCAGPGSGAGRSDNAQSIPRDVGHGEHRTIPLPDRGGRVPDLF
ncbi:MAG: histidine kinase [Candidatus Nanopelagicales bacterium]